MIYEFEYFDEMTEKTFDVQVDLKVTHEKNYGADADGNRGAPADFVEINGFQVFDENGTEVTTRPLLFSIITEFDRNHFEKASEQAIEEFNSPDDDYNHDDFD